MARQPRLVLPGVPLHLIQRGNNRGPVFLAPDELVKYRSLVRAASVDAGCAVHAYVFMTNHVHLLATPTHVGSPARFMKTLSLAYARWFNQRHGRTGTLWEGRYRSAVIDSEEYLLVCSRYIELNPVRAAMVARPGDYRWSSFRANALGGDDALLTPHPRYAALGDSPAERHAAYRALFDEALDSAQLDAIRRATNTRSGLEPLAAVAPLQTLGPRRHGGDRRSSAFRTRRR